jgi:hypothetical protein
MLVACRPAGLSALEVRYGGVNAHAQMGSGSTRWRPSGSWPEPPGKPKDGPFVVRQRGEPAKAKKPSAGEFCGGRRGRGRSTSARRVLSKARRTPAPAACACVGTQAKTLFGHRNQAAPR